MPCKDVTEMITLAVDEADRLTDYRFIKRTCGQGVGADSLLSEHLCGKTVDEILAIAPETFLETYPVELPIEEFLGLKHLIAVQSALEVLTGKAPGGPGEICAAAEVICEEGCVIIEARILLDLVTERIKSCGNCGSCGKSKKKQAETALV